mgnify:CR=1 FL=1
MTEIRETCSASFAEAMVKSVLRVWQIEAAVLSAWTGLVAVGGLMLS